MYVAITGKGKSRVIQFCEQHRIPKSTKKKTIVIKTLGNYEKMLSENPNIIMELKEEAKRLTLHQKKEKNTEILNFDVLNNGLFRFGHSLVKEVWEQLKLEHLFISSFDTLKGKKLSNNLFSLVVYRLGSSYKNFRTNREIPFLGLSTISETDFYNSLENIADIQTEVLKCLKLFFNKKVEKNKPYAFCYLSSYTYSTHWKTLTINDKKEKSNFSFYVLMLFNNQGIPISYELVYKLKDLDSIFSKWKEENQLYELISLSPELKSPLINYFLNSISLQDVLKRNQTLDSSQWNILEYDSKNNEILKKDLTLHLEGEEKLYIMWSKKLAFKDHLENNENQGYFCLHTNNINLSNIEMLNIFQHIWKIEEKFSISKVDFNKKLIKGHFCYCFICFAIIYYFQYLLTLDDKKYTPMAYINKAISNPMILVKTFGYFPKVVPIHVTEFYLKLAKCLGLSALHCKMRIKDFEKISKLEIEAKDYQLSEYL